MTIPAAEATTHTLETNGAVVSYDVRRNDTSTKPTLLLIGSPMGAAGFVTLSRHFADRTVVTYDPRGSERSRREDGKTSNTPHEHADDLSRLIDHLGAAPVDVFASSGGAVNALELIAAHPDKLGTVVAHEPPLMQVLPDKEAALRVAQDMHDTYMRSGLGAGMAKFIALVSFEGELTDEYLERPAPDPAMFGLPTEDDGTRDDPLLGQNLMSANSYEANLGALKRATGNGAPKLVVAAGAESEGQLAHRAARALADRLGAQLTMFPSHHAGFLGGEYGQSGDPDAFAAKLREVLDEGA